MQIPRICLASQTPLLRFVRDRPGLRESVPLRDLDPADYRESPGGVVRMVAPLLLRLRALGRIGAADWLSLARFGPPSVVAADGVTLRHVRLPPERLRAYAAAKAAFWDALHGIPARAGAARPAPAEVASGLDTLAEAIARRASALHAARRFDAFYVHDFQLLSLAERLPADVPRLFRWHVPVPEDGFDYLDLAVDALNEYDAVIVSTRAYAERLRAAGVRVPVHARYPYLDHRKRRVVTEDDVAEFDRAHGFAPDDVVFLLVARMDPMKRQDLAIRALAKIAEGSPRARLVLVGGGGFSGGREGSLGLPAADAWRTRLARLAEELGVRGRVVFAGSLPDSALEVAYTRARAVLLPSAKEGFGLVAIEGWLRGRPALVSSGCGVAELVQNGRNGAVFEPDDDEALAAAMQALADDPALADRLGSVGRASARACHLEPGTDAVWSILEGVLAAESRRGSIGWRR